MKKWSVLAVALCVAAAAWAQGVVGSWHGVLDVGAAKLPLVLHVEAAGDALTAKLDSPAQQATGIPVGSVTLRDGDFTFAIPQLGASYRGAFDGQKISGTFSQGGGSFPLEFTRQKVDLAPVVRPQDPQPPYPYTEHAVRFDNPSAGITLAGTLTVPAGKGPFPAVVLVSGSGPQNRDEELLNHRPFKVLSDYLTRRGIAVLRYDDRGVGESGGLYKLASLDDFASDAGAAVAYMRTRPEVDPLRVGVAGHSEGGTIAFLLAAEPENKLAFIVSMAGMAIPGDSLLRMQRELIGHAAGVPAAAMAQNEQLLTMVDALLAKYPAERLAQDLELLVSLELPEPMRANAQLRKTFIQAARQLSSPELRSLRACDPAPALRRIACRVLAVNGERDLQVAADVNLDRVQRLVKGAVVVRKYPGLNHLFQPCKTGLMDEYSAIDTTFSPEVMRDIAAWIVENR